MRLMRFFAQRTRSTKDMRASQESVHGSQVPGTNPGTRANSEVPSEIKLIGHRRQVNRGREEQVQGDHKPSGLRISKRSGIDLRISLRIKSRSSYAVKASVRPEDVGTWKTSERDSRESHD